ncbi:MAG: DUF1295 domain-containing protein [Kiritimatiellae bacterium]|nr:DUF1295 domain-containing protein [Kiritimatiellia bacterium]
MLAMYNYCLALIFGSAAAVFILLFFVPAPYGKFLRKGWGPALPARWAWMIMECPSPALMVLFFVVSPQKDIPQIIFIALWLLHYVPRTFVDPFRQSGGDKPFPLLLVALALLFNGLNGYANGYGLFHLQAYPGVWLLSWPFIIGAALFAAGYRVNRTADEKLRILRGKNPSEYQVPRGWLFEYISCPNYFGEIVEWLGWAVMTSSPAGFAFFAFTFANLFPRAIRSHKWYKSHFPEYPPQRKAVIPFVV